MDCCVAVYSKIYNVKYFEVIDTSFNDIFNIIKNASKVFDDNDTDIQLINNFIHKLASNKNWFEYDDIVFYKGFVKVLISDQKIDIKTYYIKPETTDYIFNTSKQIILNSSTINGNCIDDFINRGIEPLLNTIIDLKESIKSRCNERENTIEYHNTACYESDFLQISLIKESIEKLLSNCNRQLEAMSDKYTKL